MRVLGLLLILTACNHKSFSYGDQVIMTKGFYKNTKGKIVAKSETLKCPFSCYEVKIEFFVFNQTIDENEIELIQNITYASLPETK